MKNLKKLLGVSLAVVLCLVLVTTSVFAATSDIGTGSATLSEINEISATDSAIAFGDVTASTGQNAIKNSIADVLTFSTVNSNTPVFWKAEVTGVTKPTGAVAPDATVKGYIYWAQGSGSDAVYPAYIDVNATVATGCTITVPWAVHTANITGGYGSEVKSAEFTVNNHAWADTTGTAASSDTYRVVFTDSNKVFVKKGGTDWSFVAASADLDADATALQVSAGAGEKNFLSDTDVEIIGGTNATYALTNLVTTAGSERVALQLGKKFGFTGAAAQTQNFYALVDMPNMAAAGSYTWTITVTTAKWNVN